MLAAKTSLQITEEIHKKAKICGSYIDAIIDYSEKNSIDIEVMSALVNKSSKLKSALQDEAEDLNMIEKTSRLPV